MKGFTGFPPKAHLVKVPGMFFRELLPEIDHLGELKVTLYCFWRLQQQDQEIAYVRKSDIIADEQFMNGLGPRDDVRYQVLEEGLERASIRGTLLHVHEVYKKREDDLYFMNTPRGRTAVEAIEKGTWQPSEEKTIMLDLQVEQPNIFVLYEQNIGPLTPLIADRLRDWEETYPEIWIKEAIEAALMSNVRKVSYIEAILVRRKEAGQNDSNADQQSQMNDHWRYVKGKYKDDIDH